MVFTVIILQIGLRFLFFLDHLCHAVNEIELADCFKVSVHHMDHNLVLGLALGLAMIVELLPQLAGYAKPHSHRVLFHRIFPEALNCATWRQYLRIHYGAT